MIRHTWIALAGSTAMVLATSAGAQGQGGTAPPASQASPTAQGPAAAPAVTNSQAPANASPTGVTNANENSVLSTDEGATVAADAKTKPDKKSKATVIRAGPNQGMVINKKKGAAKDKSDAPESREDPQKD